MITCRSTYATAVDIHGIVGQATAICRHTTHLNYSHIKGLQLQLFIDIHQHKLYQLIVQATTITTKSYCYSLKAKTITTGHMLQALRHKTTEMSLARVAQLHCEVASLIVGQGTYQG